MWSLSKKTLLFFSKYHVFNTSLESVEHVELYNIVTGVVIDVTLNPQFA